MQRRFHITIVASALATLALSGTALAQSPGSLGASSAGSMSAPRFNASPVTPKYKPSGGPAIEVGPLTVEPPSEENRNRLIADVNTQPVDINLYVGATRIASKQAVNLPSDDDSRDVYRFDSEPVDIGIFAGPKRIAAKEAVNLPGLPD